MSESDDANSCILTVVYKFPDRQTAIPLFDAHAHQVEINGGIITGIANGNRLHAMDDLEEKLPEGLCRDCYKVCDYMAHEYCECVDEDPPEIDISEEICDPFYKEENPALYEASDVGGTSDTNPENPPSQDESWITRLNMDQ